MQTKIKDIHCGSERQGFGLSIQGSGFVKASGKQAGSLWSLLPSADLALDLLLFCCILPEESRHA